MPSPFKTIGIFGRVRNKGVIETLKALVHYLQHLDQNILIEAETAASFEDASLKIVKREELSKCCDLLIVVGGDGSLLHAIHTVVNGEIPILGINRGRLGFLTDIHPTELKKIKSILEGEYILESRFLLTATVQDHSQSIRQNDALN